MRIIVTALLLFISCISYSQADLNYGLKAYYPFTGNANDSSGNNNNAVYNSAALTSDRNGKPNSAYHFNGKNTCIRIPNSASLSLGNKLTICAWVRVTGFYKGPCHGNSIIMKGIEQEPGEILLRFEDGYYTDFNNCATDVIDIAHQNFYGSARLPKHGYTPYIQTNQWYSIVLTNDGRNSKIYVNCELKGSSPQAETRFTNGEDLFFGKLNDYKFPYWFSGDLDEVRIYDRALNENEIKIYGDCPVTNPLETSLYVSTINNRKIKLTWDTKAEVDIKNYSVERSTTNKSGNFISIGKISSKTNATSNKYIFIDSTAKPDVVYYYKIAINDISNTRRFTKTKTGKIITKTAPSLALPNPALPEDTESSDINSKDLISEVASIPGNNIDSAAKEVLTRKNDVQQTVYFKSDNLELSLYDNGEIDGDTVSVLMNGNIIIAKQLLSANVFSKKIAIPQDTDSIQLVMYAENLGTIPPNTGLLKIHDGKDVYEVRFSGDLKKNAMIILKREKMNAQ